MPNQNKLSHQASAVWFGFALGATLAGLSAYFLGTKKGRETLQKLLDVSEDFEGNMRELFKDWESKTNEERPSLHHILDKMKQKLITA